MAIIKCPECSKEISELSLTCPHCGYPVRRQHYLAAIKKLYKTVKKLYKTVKGNLLEYSKQLHLYSLNTYIPNDVQVEVWNRDKGICAKCGSKKFIKFVHIIPTSRGGSNTASNIQLLCSYCNKKRNKHDCT